METKITKKKSKKSQKQKSIRIVTETESLIEKIQGLPLCNLAKRKVKADRIIFVALGLLSEEQIRMLQEETITPEDRKEILRQRYITEIGPITKQGFIAFMMTDEFQEFRKLQTITRIGA